MGRCCTVVLALVWLVVASLMCAPHIAQAQPTVIPVTTIPFYPTGVAVSAAGDVYIAAYITGSFRILKVAAGTPLPVEFPMELVTTGGSYLDGMVVSAAGDLYIADRGSGQILKVPAGTTTPIPVVTGLNTPYDVAVSVEGDLYIAERGTDRILKVAAGTTTPTVFLPNTGLDSVTGVAVSAAGDVYVADSAHHRILKVPAGTTTPTIFLPNVSLYYPGHVRVTPSGDVYIVDGGNNRILKVPAGTTLPSEFLATGLSSPGRLAVTASGDVYIVNAYKYLVKVSPANQSPTASAGGPYSVAEGGAVTVTATGSDPDAGDVLTFAWDLDNNGTFETPGQSTTFSAAMLDGPSSRTISVRVTESHGLSATVQATVNVQNVAPTVGAITAPVDPVVVQASITTSAPFTDPGTPDTHNATWAWGDGTTSAGTISEANGAGTVSGNHTYTTAGVYTVILTVTDDDGGARTSTFQFVVIYDPNVGFVTGGGWIDSPPGAYTPNPALTGKATFGFVAKYQTGATVPTGQTQFTFRV